MSEPKQILVRALRKAADDIEVGNCEVSDDQAIHAASLFAHRPLSKEQACRYLNMSRAKFDKKVKLKELPKGRKVVGNKELKWYQDELDEYIKK